LRLYQERKKDGDKFHIDDHYVKYLTKLGLGKQEKKIDASVTVGGDKSWESLQNSYLLIQKDYKKKYEQSAMKVMEDLILTTFISAYSFVMSIHCK
jgi:hypothetical protein